MQTVTKTAWNPDTNQDYEIELPDNNVVEKALLEIDLLTFSLQWATVVRGKMLVRP